MLMYYIYVQCQKKNAPTNNNYKFLKNYKNKHFATFAVINVFIIVFNC